MNWAERTEAIRGHFGFYKPFRLKDLFEDEDDDEDEDDYEPPTADC